MANIFKFGKKMLACSPCTVWSLSNRCSWISTTEHGAHLEWIGTSVHQDILDHLILRWIRAGLQSCFAQCYLFHRLGWFVFDQMLVCYLPAECHWTKSISKASRKWLYFSWLNSHCWISNEVTCRSLLVIADPLLPIDIHLFDIKDRLLIQ